MVNGGLYISADGMETFLKNIKDISDTFDTIQNKLDQIYSTLETDFDGITPKILETAQSCARTAQTLKRNASYIHEQSKNIVTIAENSEISALAVFDKLEALKQRLAKLLASVGKAMIPWIGGVSVLPRIGDILKDIGNNFGGIGHGGIGHGGGGHGGIGHGGIGHGGIGHGGGGHGGTRITDILPPGGLGFYDDWGINDGWRNGVKDFAKDLYDKFESDYNVGKNELGFSLGLASTGGAAALWAASTSGSGSFGGLGLEGSASAKGPHAGYKAGLDLTNDGLKGSISGSAGVFSAGAEGKISDGKGNSVSGKAGVDIGYAEGKGSLTVGPGGVSAEAKAEVGVARATAGVTVETNNPILKEASLSGEASALSASASGKASITSDHVELKGEVGASLGKATATGSFKLGSFVTVKATAGVNAGVGAKATAEFGSKTTIGGELSFLGDLGIEISIDNKALAESAYNLGKGIYNGAKDTVSSAYNGLKNFFGF